MQQGLRWYYGGLINMDEVIQTAMSILGAVGFAIRSNVKGKKLIIAAAGGGISWSVYLIVLYFYNDRIVSLLAATITVGLLAEVLARIIKTPVTILLVPMLIPLIPGSHLYYATSYLVQGMTAEFGERLNLVVKSSGAIAFGIILVTSSVQIFIKIRSYLGRLRPQ